MKLIKKVIIISLFLAGLFLFGSCYTNKKGVVPCPTWGQTDINSNVDINRIPVSE